MKTKNNKPSSEFAHEDKCPSCGSPCNIHTDLDDNDECNDCRNQIDTLEMGQIIPKEVQTLEKYIQKISDFVTDNKAKTNNTIDLNAYGLGAIDALKKSRIDEMFEMLKLLVDRLDENDLSDLSATKRAKQLINDLSLY